MESISICLNCLTDIKYVEHPIIVEICSLHKTMSTFCERCLNSLNLTKEEIRQKYSWSCKICQYITYKHTPCDICNKKKPNIYGFKNTTCLICNTKYEKVCYPCFKKYNTRGNLKLDWKIVCKKEKCKTKINNWNCIICYQSLIGYNNIIACDKCNIFIHDYCYVLQHDNKKLKKCPYCRNENTTNELWYSQKTEKIVNKHNPNAPYEIYHIFQ